MYSAKLASALAVLFTIASPIAAKPLTGHLEARASAADTATIDQLLTAVNALGEAEMKLSVQANNLAFEESSDISDKAQDIVDNFFELHVESDDIESLKFPTLTDAEQFALCNAYHVATLYAIAFDDAVKDNINDFNKKQKTKLAKALDDGIKSGATFATEIKKKITPKTCLNSILTDNSEVDKSLKNLAKVLDE